MTRRTYTEAPPGVQDWWIVETEELGATACPSRLFAYQASEVCRGAPNFLKVINVRPANPESAMDAIAIKQSRKEIEECTMDALQRSGALDHRHRARRDVGRVTLLPRR
jgi:hypothetical protein